MLLKNSGHCPCILFGFWAAWDTVKHSFFPGTLPLIHLGGCWLCHLGPHFRFSLLCLDIKYQTGSRRIPRLPSPIIMYSFPQQSHVFTWHRLSFIPDHPLILSLTSLNWEPQTHLASPPGCQKDAWDLTCSNQTPFPRKLDPFSMFLFSVNGLLSICTVVSQPKLPLSLVYTSGV